jgi:hypothetical protein
MLPHPKATMHASVLRVHRMIPSTFAEFLCRGPISVESGSKALSVKFVTQESAAPEANAQ